MTRCYCGTLIKWKYHEVPCEDIRSFFNRSNQTQSRVDKKNDEKEKECIVLTERKIVILKVIFVV